MFGLPASAAAWGTPEFATTLAAELESLGPQSLGLQRQIARGSHLADGAFQVSVIAETEDGKHLKVRVGVFFASIIAGCSCADDPTPVEALAEYCELVVTIERGNAVAQVEPA